MTKPSKPPEDASAAPEGNILHCGFVNDLKVGMAEGNSGAGLLMEFMPALNLPPMAMILAPHLVVNLRKTFQMMEAQFGWTENTRLPTQTADK
jgi:hypothetical protein